MRDRLRAIRAHRVRHNSEKGPIPHPFPHNDAVADLFSRVAHTADRAALVRHEQELAPEHRLGDFVEQLFADPMDREDAGVRRRAGCDDLVVGSWRDGVRRLLTAPRGGAGRVLIGRGGRWDLMGGCSGMGAPHHPEGTDYRDHTCLTHRMVPWAVEERGDYAVQTNPSRA